MQRARGSGTHFLAKPFSPSELKHAVGRALQLLSLQALFDESQAILMAIKRIWHGWTSPDQADVYEKLLHAEIFPSIEAKDIPGYRGIELLRRAHGEEVEFITIMTFDSIESVIAFQGDSYRRAYVPAAAQQVLKRWDEVSAHYEVVERRYPY